MAILRRYSLEEEYELIRVIEEKRSVSKGAELHAKAYSRSVSAVAQRYYNYTTNDLNRIKNAYRSKHVVVKAVATATKKPRTILQKAKSINRIFDIPSNEAIQLCVRIQKSSVMITEEYDMLTLCKKIALRYDLNLTDAIGIYNYSIGKTNKLFKKRVTNE